MKPVFCVLLAACGLFVAGCEKPTKAELEADRIVARECAASHARIEAAEIRATTAIRIAKIRREEESRMAHIRQVVKEEVGK
jgi:hypothetical protein